MAFASASGPDALDPKRTFYYRTIKALQDVHVPFLVGGAYALRHYTGITRETKDLDLFVRPQDLEYALDTISAAGYRTEVTFTHWIGKALCGEYVVDLIFNSGNGVSEVDDSWFDHAPQGEVFGLTVLMSPAEEMIWSKAFIMERERFDGADIMHLLLIYSDRLDWRRLLVRFGPHWRVLMAHLILFGFIYPSERDRIPRSVIQELQNYLQQEMASESPTDRICRGTLLSHLQYLVDIQDWNYKDARLLPHGSMTEQEIALWTAAFEKNGRKKG